MIEMEMDDDLTQLSTRKSVLMLLTLGIRMLP